METTEYITPTKESPVFSASCTAFGHIQGAMKTITLPSRDQRIKNQQRLKAWRESVRRGESGWDVEPFKRFTNAELIKIVDANTCYCGYVDSIKITSMNRNELINDIMLTEQCFDNDEDLREPFCEEEAIEYIDKYDLNL